MIRTHRTPNELTVEVEGPATMAQSPAVHATATKEVASGLRSLRIDLRNCTTIDSTFSGTLLAMKRDLDRVGGALTLVSPSACVQRLIHEMGLDDFYLVENAEHDRGPWTELATPKQGPRALRERILDAHEELARLPIPGSAFRDVAEELRKEIDSDPTPSESPSDRPSSPARHGFHI
jgi:anti-anti-sigma factor